MKNIQLLDCTLRDGAYIVNAEFGTPSIKGIVYKLQKAGVQIIECGWLKNDSHKEGRTYYHVPSDFEQYLIQKDPNVIYTAMIDWNRYDTDQLPAYDGKSIDAVRVVFPHGKCKEGVAVGKEILKKGYKVYFQAANTLAYSEQDLIELAEEVNSVDTQCLSIVDTFGAMYEEDLDFIVDVLDKHLRPDICLGYHSHNNQQLSFAMSMHFIKLFSIRSRNIVVDSSLCGMGRGAGNATTELLVGYLNQKQNCHYNLDAVMDAIDIYMSYYQEHYHWGYSTAYFIAGMYCCHVNNIAYLLDNHRTSAKDMRNIIAALSPEDRRKYDYDLLESKYLEIMNHNVEDSKAAQALAEALKEREILLIAPGKSSLDHIDMVQNYIAEHNPVVIGVNAILPGYQYDYLFFVNGARYAYAKETNRSVFEACQKIILSNIKAAPDNGEIVLAFNSVIKRGWAHYDNAVICCLRMLDRLGLPSVTLVGFDGFKTKYNESYADPFLPTLNPDNQWAELNEEIRSIFIDFKQNATNIRSVNFLTASYFE